VKTSTIISTWHQKLERGYPTPFLGRDELLSLIQPKLKEKGVFSRGRFGGWKYEVGNQDHSLMQGVEAVDNILKGDEEAPENTYFKPDLVNARKNVTLPPYYQGGADTTTSSCPSTGASSSCYFSSSSCYSSTSKE
jgi:hypothetical protein